MADEINNDNSGALRQKAMFLFIIAGVLLFIFSVAFCITLFRYKDVQFSILMSGLFISLYFAYQGYDLLNIIKKKEFVKERYLCSSIEKSGYRLQNRKTIFLNSATKEPFIYNTTKSIVFTVGMEYEIWFRKSSHKSSINVLAVELAGEQKNFSFFKNNKAD